MSSLETIVMYGKKGRLIVNKIDQQKWADMGYKLMPEAKTETGSTGTGNANIVFDFATCSDEQIAEFAVKAGLSANVKKRETIIAKLTEAGFMPEAKTE
ncbi:MAG TPA: hypothetical protein DDW84_01410 [Phycisphaerales bacterium]|nr:hypothetical protein [Phycisphaerales bacterium]